MGQIHFVLGAPKSHPLYPIPLCCGTATEAQGGEMTSGGPVKQEVWAPPCL